MPPTDWTRPQNSKKQWKYFKGCRLKAPAPLTPEQERLRYKYWARWAVWGRKMTLGRWNMAAACARAATSYPRTREWSLRLRGYKAAAACRRKYADPVTGKVPFANGFYDQKKAASKGLEKIKAMKEQRDREKAGGKLKHYIPE